MTQSRWPGVSKGYYSDTATSSSQTPSNYRDLLAEATVQIRKLRNRLDDIEHKQTEPIAIVGMSCRFPGGANTPEAYWELLQAGVDAVEEIPAERWHLERYYDENSDAPVKMYTRYGSFVDDVDQFDPQFFGISPKEACSLDPQQRLLLETSYTALENAGLPPFDLQGSATGVFVGLSFDDYAQRNVRSGDLSQIDAFSSLGNTRSIAAGRIAYTFGFQGPTMQLDTTCSSSLLAIHLACQSLRSGESNLALAGGVNLILSPEVTIGFCKLKALSKDGRCKTFDASADGYGRGEGCGVVVLKRLSDAIDSQDNILALVKGSAVNHDGVSNGLTAPNGSAQTAVIRQAMANADITPEQIQYVEAHGTGTSLGDPIELLALNRALGGDRPSPLIVGSVKTNFGHLEAAAGIAGLMKVILSLQHQQIPSHLHLTTPNPHVPWDRLPIEIPQTLTAWPETPELEECLGREPRRAGISGFGMSGTNGHLVIEEAIAVTDDGISADRILAGDRPWHLLTLSAQNEAALRELAERYQRWLPQTTAPLSDICFSANTGRSHFACKQVFVANNKTALIQQIEEFLAQSPLRSGTSVRPKIAFLFTGQGAQYWGMARQLYETAPAFKSAIDRCALVLLTEEIDLLKVLYAEDLENAEAPAIDQTANTQPVLFSVAYALTELWASWGVLPDSVMGHSIGEYAAAVAAGVMDVEDGLRLLAARGRLMQALPSGGAMVAVMANKEQLAPLLSARVEIAAVNGPENTVISGEISAVQSVAAQLETRGIKTKPLKVSHAFHSALMEPMLAEFEQIACGVSYRSADIDFVSSVSGQVVADAEVARSDDRSDDWPKYWVKQICQPVQFSKAMETLAAEGHNIFVEIGPRPTLIAMGQSCVPSAQAVWLSSLSSPGRRSSDWKTLLSSLGTLYELGAEIDWAGFDSAYPRQSVQLPNYPFQRKRYWLEAEAVARSRGTALANERYPLLGRSRAIANQNIQCFESQLSLDEPLNWRDHQVFGNPLLPAAAYIEIGLAAAKESLDNSYYLASISLHQGLWLDASDTTKLQTLITRKDQSTYEFEIYSANDSANANTANAQANTQWIRHATGLMKKTDISGVSSIGISDADLAGIQQRLADGESKSQLYQQFSARGIDYGPAFQSIQVWSKSTTEAHALLELSALRSDRAASFLMHPVAIDAGLQLSGATLSESPLESPLESTKIKSAKIETKSYLPVEIEQFRVHQPISMRTAEDKVWVRAQRRIQAAEQRVVVDVSWISSQGHMLAEMKGLVLQEVTASQVSHQIFNQSPDANRVQWLHKLSWQAQPLPLAPADSLVPPKALCQQLAPSFLNLSQQTDFVSAQSLQPALNKLAIAYIQQALIKLGWTAEPIEAPIETATASLADAFGVVTTHRKLFARCLLLLQEADAWTALDPQPIYQQLAQQLAISAELTLLSRCGEHLADIFQGHLDSLTLLFPDGDLTDLTALYQNAPGPQLMNRLVCEAVLTTAARSPKDRTLRILEIGAGTGGTTAHLLSALSELSHSVDYLFTDISPRFITAAKARFQNFDFVDYALLNIENSVEDQGFTSSFDIVITANVLHATADLHHALSHVSALLAPGGQLLLIEGTQPIGWVDLVFGLTPGWWRFTDTALREKHPLISVEKWQRLLKSVGFESAETIQPAGSQKAAFSQSAIIAQRENTVKNWGLAGSVSKTSDIVLGLSERGQRFEALSQLEACHCDGVIYVLAAGQKTGQKKESEQNSVKNAFISDTEAVYRQALETIKLLAQSAGSSPRLYFVSVGATAEAQLSFSGLWGLLQTAQLEHPELRCTYVQAETPAQIVTELMADSPETQVIYRGGKRKAARIEDYEIADSQKDLQRDAQSPASASQQSSQLIISQKGSLFGLKWQPAPRITLGAYEIEIRVWATGLNFRDVLIAMDQYPKAAPLGCECVGEIVAVGEAVTSLKIGQLVMAIAPNSFATYVTIPHQLAVAIPPNTTAIEAATLPVAFTTAYYSLCQLAQLTAGDRVLIHSAAGGVGQAAVQIARQIGAEIFATASPSKWSVLEELGITHTMNSRSLSFADEIMTITEGKGVDVVLNALPGEFRAKSLEALGSEGRFVEIGKGEGLTAAEMKRARSDIQHFTVDISALCKENPQLVQTMLRYLRKQVSTGSWHPLLFRSFERSDTVQAFRTLQQAKHIGKVVLMQDMDALSNSELNAIAFQENATYLLTGGLGGLGLEVAQWMADKGAKRVVLLGRKAPTVIAQEKIERLRQSGVAVGIVSADVTDRDEMASVLVDIKQSSQHPLKGIIHAAGVLSDGLIEQTTWGAFQSVLAPKIAGAWNLHTLTQTCDLDFFILFSSAAALFGSPGQANHATANAFLDGLAHYRHQRGLPALSVNWGAWSDTGSALKYQQQGTLDHFSGVETLSVEDGIAQLEKVWHSATPQVGVVPINWSAFLTQPAVSSQPIFERQIAVRSPLSTATRTQHKPSILSDLSAAPYEQKRALLQSYICGQICQILGFSADELDMQKGFFDLGMDSLTALELKNILQIDLNVSLPTTLAFDYPTVEALIGYLAAQLIEENTLASESDLLLALETPAATALEPSEIFTFEDDLIAEMDRKLADIDNLLGEDAAL